MSHDNRLKESSLVDKTINSLRERGLLSTLLKVTSFILRPYVERRLAKRIFRHDSIADRFTEIYRLNAWGSSESVSGNGSTIALTENVRSALPRLFAMFQIKSVFDAPCGDFNWMQHLIREFPIDYVGADIVEPLVVALREKYGSKHVRFLTLDLTASKFPKADLMICRDCLFHLSYKDTRSLLVNFILAEIPYLLTSTHLKRRDILNKDISTGGFRLINLFAEPYYFSPEVIFRFDDIQVEQKETEMCLWTRDQIIDAVNKFDASLSKALSDGDQIGRKG